MKTFFISLLMFTAFFLSTALSSAQDKKVAVVTFFINRQIDVTEFGTEAYLAVQKLSDDPRFNLSPLLEDFHSRFFESYSKDFPFQLWPENDVINNDKYKTFVPDGIATSGILKATNYLTPVKGYKIILPALGHENEKQLVKIFDTADGVMDVSINFRMIKFGFGGMGVVKVKAIATILLYNKQGNKVFAIDEDATSKSVSPLVSGIPVMTLEKIMPMCQSAIDELMIELQKDLPKIAKKANSKL